MGWLRFLPTRLIFSIWVLFRKLYPKWSLIRTCFWSERLGLALDQNMTKYWQRWDSERHVYHRGGGLLRHPCWVTLHSAFLVAHPTSGTAWLGKGVGKGGWVLICKVTLFFMGEGHCFNTGLSYIIPESLYLVGCCKSSGNTPPLHIWHSLRHRRSWAMRTDYSCSRLHVGCTKGTSMCIGRRGAQLPWKQTALPPFSRWWWWWGYRGLGVAMAGSWDEYLSFCLETTAPVKLRETGVCSQQVVRLCLVTKVLLF